MILGTEYTPTTTEVTMRLSCELEVNEFKLVDDNVRGEIRGLPKGVDGADNEGCGECYGGDR
jgi:hypothetical protein